MHITRSIISVILLFAATGWSPLHAGDTSAPNFLIIYMDDLGWADTSVAMMDEEPLSRSDYYQTPALERLAAQGMRFSNGYAPTPTCTGSRISIQFGQTSARLQYRNVFDVLSQGQRTKDGWDREVSMAQVVKDAGNNYITAHFGKGMNVRRMDHAGYDVTDEDPDQPGGNGNAHGHYIDTRNKIPIPDDNAKRIPDLTRLSVDFVKKHAGKRPFFMMISHYAVHVPFQASPEAVERARQRWLGTGRPDVDVDSPKYKKSMEYKTWQYAGMIEQCDTHLGALMHALEEAGELDNTYIVYTSDNGGGFSRHDENGRRFNGPLQEGKRSVFEGGLRIPFVVAGPGIRAGSQCDVPVVQWDLLPTLHDLSGNKAPLPPAVDGGSLRDVFERGNEGSVPRQAPGLVFHYPCHFHPPVSVLRIGDYKYMKHLNSGDMKLFNVAKDYAEENDLSASMPGKTAEMERLRQAYIDDVDGGEVSEVYAAFFDRMDEFEQGKLSALQGKRGRREQDKPAEDTALQKEEESIREEFSFKRAVCRAQMVNPSWRESISKATFKKEQKSP